MSGGSTRDAGFIFRPHVRAYIAKRHTHMCVFVAIPALMLVTLLRAHADEILRAHILLNDIRTCAFLCPYPHSHLLRFRIVPAPAQFTDYFAQINCQGEVKLHEAGNNFKEVLSACESRSFFERFVCSVRIAFSSRLPGLPSLSEPFELRAAVLFACWIAQSMHNQPNLLLPDSLTSHARRVLLPDVCTCVSFFSTESTSWSSSATLRSCSGSLHTTSRAASAPSAAYSISIFTAKQTKQPNQSPLLRVRSLTRY